MNSTQILSETFASHEHLAPDADLALDGIQHRVSTLRQSRIAVAGVVTTVAAMAVGGAVLAGAARHTAHDPAAHQPMAATTQVAPAPDYVTIAAGWLPPGKVLQTGLSNGFGRQTHGYDVTATGGTSTHVLVSTEPGTALPTTYKLGTPHDLTVGGLPAREWSVDDWYYLAILQLDGQVVAVEIRGGPNQGKGLDGSAAALTAVGQKVGANLDLNRHDSINPSFGLSDLPAGVEVRAASRDHQSGTAYTIASPSAQPSETSDYARVSEFGGSWASRHGSTDPALSGRPVQGHPTYVIAGRAFPGLWIDNVHPGVSISIVGGPGVTTIADVYKIADGLILSP